MKKVLISAAVSTALLVGSAAVASAGAIELDGYLRTRGVIDKANTAKDSASNTYYDQKAAIGVKGKVSDEVTGYMRLETGTSNKDKYIWGGETNAELQAGGYKNDDSSMRLVQAWIDYKPSFWGVKVGHQPLALGEKLFFDHTKYGDDAINLYGDLAGTQFNLIGIKLQERQAYADGVATGSGNTNDVDAYVVNLSRVFGDSFTGGLNYTYLKGGTEDNNPITNPFPGMRMSNLGFDGKFKFGALNVTADFEKQFGTLKDDGTGLANTALAAHKLDAQGYAYQLTGDYAMGNSSVGLLYAVGSGDDNPNDTNNDTFVDFLSDVPYQVYIPGYRAGVPGAFGLGNGDVNGNDRFTGLSNLTVYQVNAKTETEFIKPLTLFGSLSYLQTTEDVNTNIGGTARMEDSLGTEIDMVATWKLTENLAYMVEAGYLFAGDAWKTAANNDPDNMYFLRHGLSLSF